MKRTVTILLVLALGFSVFAATNGQTIYSVDDPIYKQIYSLYLAEGYGAPSSSGPWSGNELLHMMDKISRADLSEPLQKVYDEVMAKLNPEATLDFDSVAFGITYDADLAGYYRQQGVKDGATAAEILAEFGELLTAATSAPTADAIQAYNNCLKKNPTVEQYLNANHFAIENAVLPETVGPEFMATAQALGSFVSAESIEAFITSYFRMTDDNAESDWFHGYQYRKPFFTVNFETWAADNFYGYFGLGLGDTDLSYLYAQRFNTSATLLTGLLGKAPNEALNKGLGKHAYAFNIFGEPMKAIASVGGDRWNVVAGRDKLSWGVGETGNLMLSDSFPQHTFIKFATYHNVFKYSLLGTIYPFYENYNKTIMYGQSDAIIGYKSMIAHRLEFSFLQNKLNFAVTEACMFRAPGQTDYEVVDGEKVYEHDGFVMALVNPFGFMHNEYNRINGNSLLVFEADGTPIKGLNVYGQFAIDDFALPGASDAKVPAATGLLAGVRGVYEIADGLVKFNAEYVKTDPFLYLRGAYEDVAEGSYGKTNPGSYGYGYDAIYRHFMVDQGVYAEDKFITYKYGNDVKIFQAKAAYEKPGLFEAGVGIFVKNSGIMDIKSPWGVYGSDAEGKEFMAKTPSLIDPFNGDREVTENEAAEKETVITISGVYHTPIENLDVYGYADFLSFSNYMNIKGAKHSDVQATFGVKYSF